MTKATGAEEAGFLALEPGASGRSKRRAPGSWPPRGALRRRGARVVQSRPKARLTVWSMLLPHTSVAWARRGVPGLGLLHLAFGVLRQRGVHPDRQLLAALDRLFRSRSTS